MLCVLIAGLLGVVLVFLPEQKPDATESKTATGDTPSDEQTADGREPSDEEGGSESRDYKTAVPEKPKEVETVEGKEKTKAGGRLYIIIDDVGNNLSDLEYFLKVQVPVTFAVMPERTFSRESAKKLAEAGFDMILHQPMEPEGDHNPGAGAIKTGMGKEQIYKILEKNLQAFPEIRGINNHMGSKATADKEVMNAVMSFLKQRDMFFLDSVTTDKSIAEETATSLGVSFAKRNAIFLDNEGERASIEKAFRSGTGIAAATGSAIMIGHLKSRVLLDVINEMSVELRKSGYNFYGISSLFKEGGPI